MTTTATFGVFCPGMLDVLSIGKGDLNLSIDGDHPEDVERARELIGEMLRAGYAIFVDSDDGPVRVHEFNPNRMTYTIRERLPEELAGAAMPALPPGPAAKAAKKAAKRGTRREVPVAGSRATAVGRTAGG